MSYAHEDHEFVLALVPRLQEAGLDIRYDRVVLQIGDSLIERISAEIAEGDFLIAVISPDSVASGWCRHELAVAATQGINEQRVKVLPVKFRGAAMPSVLADKYWADADRESIETIARRLAAAMNAYLEGRGADAATDAQEAPEAPGQAAHEEVAGDAAVADIDAAADRAMDVFDPWIGMLHGGNIRDIQSAQRRLRLALDKLPGRARLGLPLVAELARADWDGFFGVLDPDAVERDIRDEILSVRTQVAQGLPVTMRWRIAADLGPVSAGGRDAESFLWEIERGDESRRVQFFISGTAVATGEEYLPEDVAEARRTNGRSAVAGLLSLEDPPRQVMATTAGISLTLPA